MANIQMTPDELRQDADWYDPHPCAKSMRAAADAWEKERQEWADALLEWEEMEPALRKRLEAAEKWRGIAGSMADLDPWIAERCGYNAAPAEEEK